jgi:DNA repair protein RecN (Recombination protein N)
MLTSLRIQNVVLIDQITIGFEGGLCALTGETGAGKSILLDSLGLALGARADSGLVRKGTEQASVTASFDLSSNHISKKILKNADLDWEQTLIIRRTLGADGRSKAFINDQPVSIGLLKEIGDSLVEIHGQFDTQGLLNPSSHRTMLDDYAQIGSGTENAWQAWQREQESLLNLKNASKASKAEEEFLRTALEDLDALEPKAGEEQTLAALRERLMHREQVLAALSNAYEILNGESDPVRAAWSALDKISTKLGEEGAGAISALERANAEMQEAISAISALSSSLEESEHDLQSIDDRLFALRAQARKHGCSVDNLSAKREELAAQLGVIDHADELLEQAEKKVTAARAAYIAQAEKISTQRMKAAAKLDLLVAKELPPLKLEKAKFVTSIEKLARGRVGAITARTACASLWPPIRARSPGR